MSQFQITAKRKGAILSEISIQVSTKLGVTMSEKEKELIKHAHERLREFIVERMEQRYPLHKQQVSDIFYTELKPQPTLFDQNL